MPGYQDAVKAVTDTHKNNEPEEQINEKSKEVSKFFQKSMAEFTAYMQNSDPSKYGTLLNRLETQYSLGQDQYPKNRINAHSVISNHAWDPQ